MIVTAAREAMKAAICAVFLASASTVSLAAADDALGPETNLPLPRFVSLKSDKANIRRGPGLTHRIDWVFLRRGMPLEVIAEHGHWRRVRDVDDATGWVHHALLRGARSAVVIAPRAALRDKPDQAAEMAALAEAGVILNIERCERNWCEVGADGHEGWIRKAEIWGAREDETFD